MDRKQVLETIYAALGEGDIETMREHVRDDVQIVERLEVPGARVYDGVADWQRGYEREAETIDRFGVELLDVEEIGDRCVADVVIKLRGKGSGAEVEERLAHLAEFDGDRVSRWRAFSEIAEAREQAMRDEVAELYELWQHGHLPEAIARVHPEIEWVEPMETIGAQRRAGRDAAVEGINDWIASFDSYDGDLLGIEVVDGRVLVEYVQRVRGGGSSVAMESKIFHVWDFRDGKPARMAMYFDRDQALNE